MSLVVYAEQELAKINSGDELDEFMVAGIIEMVKIFSAMEHSGSTAQWCRGALHRLLNFQPLTPLTGERDEWIEYVEGKFQNRRCPTVFRDAINLPAYDISLVLYRYPDGLITDPALHTPIVFPYTPGNYEFIEKEYEQTPETK